MKKQLIVAFILFSFKILAQPPATAIIDDRQPLFQSFDGSQIHYETIGEGRPVVLLHGFISNSNSWKKSTLINTLKGAGFKVILVDLRGNGLSDKPHDTKLYEKDAEIKDVMALMKFLGFKTYDVVGYSRGAILAARQITIDKRVRSVVLGGIGADFTNPNWARRKAFEEAFSGKAHLHPEAKGAIEAAKASGADTLVLGYLQKNQPSTSKTLLAAVKTPVLVIAGDKDLDNGNPADLAAIFQNSTLRIVQGNHSTTAQSAEFVDEVVRFLTGH